MGKQLFGFVFNVTIVFGFGLILPCLAQQSPSASPSPSSCSTYKFSNNKEFRACSDLPVLDSHLHWNYDPSLKIVDLAFRHTGVTHRRWIAWGINPTSQGMVGTQALITYPKTDGSMAAYASPLTSYGTMLQPGNVSMPVYDVSATYQNNELILFAKIGLAGNSSVVNHIWQEGPLAGDTLMMHSIAPSSPNLRSFGQLDFLSGKITAAKASGGSWTTTLKYAHGGLNAISWGILMPAGSIIARNFKSIDPLWFKLHRGCQGIAFILGTAGFITGLVLGYKSTGIQFTAHRFIGIALFVMAVSQVGVAMFARPAKDSKKRPYFNWFHWTVGYATVVLSVANIFEGLRILQGTKVLLFLYIAVLALLGCAAVVSEVWRRCILPKSKAVEENHKVAHLQEISIVS